MERSELRGGCFELTKGRFFLQTQHFSLQILWLKIIPQRTQGFTES